MPSSHMTPASDLRRDKKLQAGELGVGETRAPRFAHPYGYLPSGLSGRIALGAVRGCPPPRSADVAEHIGVRPVLSAPVARAMAWEYVRQVESQLGMSTPRQPMVWLPSLVCARRLERVVYRLAAEPAWSLRPAVAVPRPHANLAPNRARPVIRHFPSEMEKPPFREACVHCNAIRWNLCSDVVSHGHTWSTFRGTRARRSRWWLARCSRTRKARPSP